MTLSAEHLDALVVAALATYSYSLEKAWALREGFQAARLCEPAFVASQDAQTVGNLMKAAGYDRGGITYIIAPRLIELMGAIGKGQLDGLPGLVAAKDEEAVVSLVKSLKGFGPKSAMLVWELLKSPE